MAEAGMHWIGLTHTPTPDPLTSCGAGQLLSHTHFQRRDGEQDPAQPQGLIEHTDGSGWGPKKNEVLLAIWILTGVNGLILYVDG